MCACDNIHPENFSTSTGTSEIGENFTLGNISRKHCYPCTQTLCLLVVHCRNQLQCCLVVSTQMYLACIVHIRILLTEYRERSRVCCQCRKPK